MKALINVVINGKAHQNRFQEIKEDKQNLPITSTIQVILMTWQLSFKLSQTVIFL